MDEGLVIDLEAERAASLSRTTAARDASLLRIRASALRNEPGPGTLEDRARRRWPNWSDEKVAAVVAAAMEPVDRGRHVPEEEFMLTKEQVLKHASDYLKANPDAMPAAVWSYVLEHGTPKVTEASFKTYHIYKVRVALGLPRLVDPDRRAGSTAAAKRRQQDAPPPAAEPSEPSPPSELPVVAAPLEAEPLPDDGDRVLIELAGRKLVATRAEGDTDWTVRFEGNLSEALFESLTDAVFAGRRSA